MSAVYWELIVVGFAIMLVVALSSMGLPGLNGFVGEFTILLGAFGSKVLGSPWYAGFAALGVILAAESLRRVARRSKLVKLLISRELAMETAGRLTAVEQVDLLRRCRETTSLGSGHVVFFWHHTAGGVSRNMRSTIGPSLPFPPG